MATDERGASSPASPAWKSKRTASTFVGFMLILMAVIYTLALAGGLSRSQPSNGSLVTAGDVAGGVDKLLVVVEGVRSGFTVVAILDVGATSLFIHRRLVQSKCLDTVTRAMLFIVAPTLLPLAIQTAVTSSIRAFKPVSEERRASLDFYTLLVSSLVTGANIVVLSFLYARPSRWTISGPEGMSMHQRRSKVSVGTSQEA
ncbi:hypothetical protein FRC17_002067 [Serendipita sp. 399]|nr:hypothetical protein FRC17_002067 [Serendipita sp. 399]